MKSIRMLLSVLIVALALAGSVAVKNALAQHQMHQGGKPTTVKGEIVDLTCYISHGGKGASHKQCAITCINKGLPMGVLTKDGKLYLLIEDHQKPAAYTSAKKYAGKQATVSGELATKDGIKAIEVESVK